ncbi:MAG: glycine cleavage T C-terminal barrel domain-containing protein [Gemmatimonadota bacterium]
MREADGYAATLSSSVAIDRSYVRFLRVSGRAPTQMLKGLVSGSIPPALSEPVAGIRRGRVTYSALLTPKGKTVTDLRITRLENGEGGSLLLEFPPSGIEGAEAHFRKYLPPRFARLESLERAFGLLSVIGPGAVQALATAVEPWGGDAALLATLGEGEEVVLDEGPMRGVRLVRSGEVIPVAFDVVGDAEILEEIGSRLEENGTLCPPEGSALWNTLRIERGRPAFGIDFDGETLPPEVGITDRAIDHRKGCYTGQEVIVRIRDRGKVNRRLHGLLLGTAPPPDPGTPLYAPERSRPVGETRSSVPSPRFGQTVALGYLRQEVGLRDTIRLGTPDGLPVAVRALEDRGWVLVEGDPDFVP